MVPSPPPLPARRAAALPRGGACWRPVPPPCRRPTPARWPGAADPGAAVPGAEAAADDFPGVVWAPADPSNPTDSSRPATYPVRCVVVHVAQETFADTVAIFPNPARDVSAHYVVASNGRIASASGRRTSAGTRGTGRTTPAASASSTRAGWTSPRGSPTRWTSGRPP